MGVINVRIIIIFKPGTKIQEVKKLAQITINPVDPWNNRRAGELR